MKSQVRTRIIFLLLIALAGGRSAFAQEAPLVGFDDYVSRAMRDWEVPGLAIAIVKNDKVLLAKGYGARKLGESAAVDERTMFAVGSTSKAFTAATIAMLVDEGKIKWDDPVTKFLPGFQLYDTYATREITVRDLLSHRSGLERGDLLWYATSYDRDEILRRVRYLKPGWSFRSRFGYQNIMFLGAGQVVATVSGKSWDEFVRQRIFTPLEMASTNTSIVALKSLDNVASPHAKLDGKVRPVAWRNIDNIGPAGSINSNALDMAQWIRLQLGEGKYKDSQLLSSGSIKEMHMPQTVLRFEGLVEKLNPETHFLNYGLGWMLQDYRGRKVVQHGGNIDGMSAIVAMMPEEKLGLVILTNLNSTRLPGALMYKVFDAFLQAPARDWSADLLKVAKAQLEQAAAAEKKKEEDRTKGTSPSLPLSKYAGTYNDDMHGAAKVNQEKGKLVVRFGPAFTGDLEHWHYDTFRVNWRDPMLGNNFATFVINAQGKAGEVRIDNLAGFTRAADKPEPAEAIAMSEDELKKFVGRYEMKTPPMEVSVEMIGGKLKAVMPARPVAALVPVAVNRFQVVADDSPIAVFAQFDMAEGRVRSLIIEQGPAVKLTLVPKQ
jgi:CubicO group peptidase (beta-lactamase class C family)